MVPLWFIRYCKQNENYDELVALLNNEAAVNSIHENVEMQLVWVSFHLGNLGDANELWLP
jgi:hypothetical protein